MAYVKLFSTLMTSNKKLKVQNASIFKGHARMLESEVEKLENETA